MKKALLLLSLLFLGFPQLASAAGGNCAGDYRSAVYVENDQDKDVAYIFTYYDKKNDVFCSSMKLSAAYDNVSRPGRLIHYVCTKGIDANGNCKGNADTARDQDDGTQKYFGGIRTPGWDHCIKAFGYIQTRRGIASASSKWHCS